MSMDSSGILTCFNTTSSSQDLSCKLTFSAELDRTHMVFTHKEDTAPDPLYRPTPVRSWHLLSRHVLRAVVRQLMG
jgi:hypothetical protein